MAAPARLKGDPNLFRRQFLKKISFCGQTAAIFDQPGNALAGTSVSYEFIARLETR
jgi:hypothetical protein